MTSDTCCFSIVANGSNHKATANKSVTSLDPKHKTIQQTRNNNSRNTEENASHPATTQFTNHNSLIHNYYRRCTTASTDSAYAGPTRFPSHLLITNISPDCLLTIAVVVSGHRPASVHVRRVQHGVTFTAVPLVHRLPRVPHRPTRRLRPSRHLRAD